MLLPSHVQNMAVLLCMCILFACLTHASISIDPIHNRHSKTNRITVINSSFIIKNIHHGYHQHNSKSYNVSYVSTERDAFLHPNDKETRRTLWHDILDGTLFLNFLFPNTYHNKDNYQYNYNYLNDNGSTFNHPFLNHMIHMTKSSFKKNDDDDDNNNHMNHSRNLSQTDNTNEG